MSAATHNHRPWAIARHRMRADLIGGVALWAAYLVFVLAMVATVRVIRGPIEISGWDVASQLPRWYAGALGVYLTAVYLPLYIAHGWTRRTFARQAPVFAGLFAAMLGVLMAVGYLVEAAVYRVAGWPQELTAAHLFDAPTDVVMVTSQFVLVFAAWVAAGALVGAGFYRNPGLGLLVTPLALAMLAILEATIGGGPFPLVGWALALVGISVGEPSIGALAGVSAIVVAVGVALTWLVIRDMPMRGRAT